LFTQYLLSDLENRLIIPIRSRPEGDAPIRLRSQSRNKQNSAVDPDDVLGSPVARLAINREFVPALFPVVET